MPKKFSWFTDQASAMYERDKKLRLMQEAMERMSHLDYTLPASMQRLDWVRKIVSTAPFDALRAATRALANLDERIKLEPVSILGEDDDPEGLNARRKANAVEKTLKWQLDLLAERQGTFRSDIVRSAVLYDEVVFQIIHLPTQKKIMEQKGDGSMRYQAALRGGDFAIVLYDPKTVHVRYSRFMAEAVLAVTVMEPQEIVDFWGKSADAIKTRMDDDDAPDKYTVFEYCDYEQRCIWCVEGEDEERGGSADEAIQLVPPEKNPYPFLPWVAVRGGTNIDTAPEYQRIPMLAPIYWVEAWGTTNITGTLLGSKTLAEAMRPTMKAGGAAPEDVQVDFTEPGGMIVEPIGTTVSDMVQKQMDPAMAAFADKLEAAIEKTTIARVLVTADTQAGESFSGYNLRVQTAIGSLTPFKEVAERAVAQALKLMLYWCHFTKTPIVGYGKGKKDAGKRYEISPEDINPERLYLTIELTPDVPLDRQQRVNSAIMMADKMHVSARYLLEYLGETDPDGVIREKMQEDFLFAIHQGKMQMIAADASGQLQQMAQQLAMQMMQQQMEQAQQGQMGMGQPGSMPGEPTENPGLGPGMPGVGGQGFNPAGGGMPPAMANPAGNVREQQMGMDSGGMPV
jgi:hypothetical protein